MDWAERFGNLNQWRRRGERAPHKPLLLLYALGRFQQHGDTPIPFSDAEESLARLLREFGPPRPTNPGYPFHHLTNDKVWVVSTASGGGSPGPGLTALRRENATGRFAPELAHSLRSDPRLLAELAHILLDTNFEESLREDICAAVGLDLAEAERGTAAPLAHPQRDPEFRSKLLMVYEYRCAFCGYDGLLDGMMVGLEAAHVQWLTHGGPNDVDNGLCLCSLHHKLFDKGVLGITGHHRVTVSARFIGRSAAAEQLVASLSDRPLNQPLKGFPPVSITYVAWHEREVFRGPARAA